MKRLIQTIAIALASALLFASTASAEFGFEELDATFTEADGSPVTQAGSHPFKQATTIAFNTHFSPDYGFEVPFADPMNLTVSLPPGLVADVGAAARCSTVDFVAEDCQSSSQVGMNEVTIDPRPGVHGAVVSSPVYNLVPPPGVVAKLGFVATTVPITVEIGLNSQPPYNGLATLTNIPNVLPIYRSVFSVWGVPGDPAHDSERGCGPLGCPALSERPFLTLPTSCTGPLLTSFEALSWQEPNAEPVTASVLSHDNADPPNPLGMTGCGSLAFDPSTGAQPTSKAGSSPSGLDFSLDVGDEGITNPDGRASSTIRKTVVTLPEGMSANPSLAEGLNVCTEAQLAKETAFSDPGAGCPNASKIGAVEVETPLLEEIVKGSVFIAEPYENPFDSLLAMYVVLQNRNLGISVKQPLEVIPDPLTGQLTTIAEDMPQLPFSHFRLHFREGTRSPLATPSACGEHTVKAVLYPWAGGAPVTSSSTFEIITGPGEGPCPKGGLPPLKPGLIAGTINNRAGSFSPFNLRMYRSDAEQEITRFSIKLPPGITGKLAGIPYCPDAAIAAAKARTGPHGGQEELENPSCPAASEIGRTLAGAGVGPALTYAPGKVYLAGPYYGSKLSVVAITAGVVGPFDIGTVVIRQALEINPETAEVFIDSTGSDPIPHIIQGIPVHLRDIRAYVDKPDFVLNPTDCTRTSTASTVLGSGLDFVSQADDNPFTATSPFQAADCAALPFKPQLTMRLIGGTKRGAFPKFRAHLAMNGIGEAGIQGAQVVLPESAFIEQGHFQTICTRPQFKAGAGNGSECPAGSVYGKATAITPILSEPLTGPVLLRANGGERDLPDLVVALRNSQVDFNLVGFVDSVNGRLRNTFASAPDAPVTSFDIELAGGQKGLFVNSRNLCKRKYRADVTFTGQNGKTYTSKPVLKAKCKKAKAKDKAKRQTRAALHRMRAAG